MNNIHPTAIIDSQAEIGTNVDIGPYCVVGAHVVIGNNSKLHSHVTITGPTTIGSDNEFYPFSVIGADPQDLKFHGEQATLLIGDRNQIREHVTIHRGTHNGGGVTRVGNDNLIMVAAHIAHDCLVGSHCVIANLVMLGGHAVIEDCVNIGGGTGVHHYATIGTMAFVGGLARVKKDVPPYMKVDGDPVEVRGVNTIALARRHYSEAEISGLKDAFKRLYLHKGGTNGNNGHNGNHLSSTVEDTDNSDSETPITPPAPMSVTIDELLHESGHLRTVKNLCDSLLRSANGVHGRSRELRREDKKFATQPK